MDVLEIAKDRRSKLSRELSKLDEFIRVGEELCKSAQPAAAAATATAAEGSTKKEPATLREFSGNSAAARSG